MSPDLRYPGHRRDNLEYRRRVLGWARGDEERQDALIQICSGDLDFWVGTFVWTYRPWTSDPTTRDNERDWPFIPWAYQREKVFPAVEEAVDQGHDLGATKSRDMGLSWCALLVFLHRWLFFPRRSFIVSTDNEDKVDATDNPDSLMWKLDYVLEHLPGWMTPELDSSDRTHFHLRNPDTKSVINGACSTKNLAAGGRRDGILMDEIGRWDFGREAVTTTSDVAPCRLFFSTAQGRGNVFWDLKSGQRGQVPFIDAYWIEHPEKSTGLYRVEDGEVQLLDDFSGNVWVFEDSEWKQYRFPENYPFVREGLHARWPYHSPWFDSQCNRRGSLAEIAQELEREFVRSGNPFFDIEVLDEIKRTEVFEPVERRQIDWEYDPIEEHVNLCGCRPHPRGRLRLWQHVDEDGLLPQDTGYVVGVDVSKGTGASNSVVSIFNTGGVKIGEYASPDIRPEQFAQLVVALCRWVGGRTGVPYLLWEANGPGINMGNRVIAFGYTRFYRNRDELAENPREGRRPGWFASKKKKRHLLSEYRGALARPEVTVYDRMELEEASRYVEDKTGRVEIEKSADADTEARESHGDRVTASALCYLGLKIQREIIREETAPGPPPNSVAGRRLRRRLRSRTDAYWR